VHPLSSSIKIFSKKYNSKPNQLDKKIIKKFLSFLLKNKIKIIDSGQWEWINKNIKNRFVRAINCYDVNFLLIELTNFFKYKSSYGLISSTYENVFKKKKKIFLNLTF